MAKKTEVTTVTVVATGNQVSIPKTSAQVAETIEMLKKQLEILKGGKEESISLEIYYKEHNIKNVDKVSTLLEIASAIEERNAAYNKQVKRYELEGKIQPFSVSEKSAEDWDKIIEKAINEKLNSSQIKNLESAIESLSKHLSAEDQLAADLAKVMSTAGQLIA